MEHEANFDAARRKIVQALDKLFSTRSFLEKQSDEWNTVLKTESDLFRLLKSIETKESGGKHASSSWAAYNPDKRPNDADRPASRW